MTTHLTPYQREVRRIERRHDAQMKRLQKTIERRHWKIKSERLSLLDAARKQFKPNQI